MAVPANSRLYIDNILLPQNPSIARYPRDGKDHVLRADAPGFEQKTQIVKFNTARMPVTLTLERDVSPFLGSTREVRRVRQ